MYTVHQESGANQGETPGIGESPSSQPISGPVIFSKRQALSRAVVVNSNMSREKYLARKGPGSRLAIWDTYTCTPVKPVYRAGGERNAQFK